MYILCNRPFPSRLRRFCKNFHVCDTSKSKILYRISLKIARKEDRATADSKMSWMFEKKRISVGWLNAVFVFNIYMKRIAQGMHSLYTACFQTTQACIWECYRYVCREPITNERDDDSWVLYFLKNTLLSSLARNNTLGYITFGLRPLCAACCPCICSHHINRWHPNPSLSPTPPSVAPWRDPIIPETGGVMKVDFLSFFL